MIIESGANDTLKPTYSGQVVFGYTSMEPNAINFNEVKEWTEEGEAKLFRGMMIGIPQQKYQEAGSSEVLVVQFRHFSDVNHVIAQENFENKLAAGAQFFFFDLRVDT